MDETSDRLEVHEEVAQAAAEAPPAAGSDERDERDERIAALERERDAWQRERLEMLTREEVERQARRLGLVDEEAAWRLIDQGALERDGSGRPTNAEALLRALAAERPWLARPEPRGGATGGSASNSDAGRDTRLSPDALRQMTPEQINADWTRVQEALRRV